MNYIRLEKTSLLCLSPELVTAIAEEMQVADIKQLRLTCSTIADYLVPLVFRTIKLTVYGNKCQWGVNRIEALASGTHPACHASRALTIGPLCPGKPLDRSYLFTFRYQTQTRSGDASETNVNEPLEITIAREKVASHLFNAITSCRGVRAVVWTPSAEDEKMMHQITMNSLKNLPSLRRLHIRFQDFDVPLEMDSLRSLTELVISIEKCSSERLNTILDNVAKAVGQNPALVSIELDVSQHESQNQEIVPLQHFKRFLKYYSTANEPMRLRHLKLTSFNLLLDQISISHLRHLTSLNLCRVKCKNGVWEPFIEAGICLTEISVDWASQSFCNYLASYTGLKKLSLMAYDFSTVEDSDTMAILFYEIGLDNHAQSLEDVKIVPMNEGLWCFGSHNYKSIAQLTNLRHLEMNVLSYDVRNNGETQANGTQKITENNAVKHIVDLAVLCMESIETICLDYSPPPRGAGRMCGTGVFRQHNFVLKQLVKCVESYVAPSSCKHIPSLTVTTKWQRHFIGRNLSWKDGEMTNSMLVYVETTPRNIRRRALVEWNSC